jgi:hypothetical protein
MAGHVRNVTDPFLCRLTALDDIDQIAADVATGA